MNQPIALPPRTRIEAVCRQAWRRIEQSHIKCFAGQPGPIFLISTAYPGVWLEHAFDAVCYRLLRPEDPQANAVALNQMRLFLANQTPEGRLPYCVLDEGLAGVPPERLVGYGQIQECVAFGQLCLTVYRLTGDQPFLEEAYRGLCRWDAWQSTHRMRLGAGLIELFCLYDTGHDNSARLAGIPNKCPDALGAQPAEADALPILAPDMNAVFFGDRMALSEMARLLGDEAAARDWRAAAGEVRRAMFELLYDPADEFFYDRDRHGRLRRVKSISIANVFGERLLTQAEFDRIYARHLANPREFAAPYPYPSLAMDEPGWVKDRPGNSWGYYAQALTALRAMRYMDFYGKSADYDRLLAHWVAAYASQPEARFAQELDPLTGEQSASSEGYSSGMLTFLYGVKRLGLLD